MVLSIPRLVTILFVIGLYGIAFISIIKKPKKSKVSSFRNIDIKKSAFDYKGPERRIYPRARLSVVVRYKVYSKKAKMNIFKEGRAIDISEGGIGIVLEINENLAVSDKLELKLKLPIASQFMLVRGKVVWNKEIEAGKWYHHGISFTQIDINDRKIIAKYVTEAQPAEDVPNTE